MSVKMRTPLVVTLENRAEPYELTSDQRDLAAWEAHDTFRPGTHHLMLRFVAWSAMRRNELYTGTWRQFNTVDCLEVESLIKPEDVDGEDEQGLDPGNRPTSATD